PTTSSSTSRMIIHVGIITSAVQHGSIYRREKFLSHFPYKEILAVRSFTRTCLFQSDSSRARARIREQSTCQSSGGPSFHRVDTGAPTAVWSLTCVHSLGRVGSSWKL